MTELFEKTTIKGMDLKNRLVRLSRIYSDRAFTLLPWKNIKRQRALDKRHISS